MALKFWKFQYTPPKTLATPVPEGAAASASVPTGTDSQAVQLMGQLDALIATSAYLQQVMLARSKGLGIAVDPAVDPEVARALEVVYGVDEAPKFVTVEMYNHLLDAEMTALQIEMALPTDSPYEVNGFQSAAASTVTAFVENKLVETGEFQHQIPLLLRDLKGDTVIFASTKEELAKYPAARPRPADPLDAGNDQPIKARTLDISHPLANALEGYLDGFAGTYASMYQLAADVGHVEAGIEDVVSTYFLQPVEDIIRIVSLFQALKGLVHIPRLKTIKNGLTGLVFVRLQAEATGARCFYDRFTSLATSPLKSMAGSLGNMLGVAQSAIGETARLNQSLGGLKDGFSHTEGTLKGMSYAYDCGLPHNANAKKPTAAGPGNGKVMNALGQASQALTSLATHLKWGMDSMDAKTHLVDEAFNKISTARLGSHADQLDLMCSTQALDSLLNLGRAVISVQQKYTGSASPSATSTPSKQLEEVGRILATNGGGTGTQFAMQDGQIQATSPDVPPVPVDVEPVLRRGGLDRTVPVDLRDINGVLA
jgi:hypothetical protein